MGKGRGKLKKQSTVAETPVSGGEEKILPLKRRGRPLKVIKKESKEKEETKVIEAEVVNENVPEENGKKRKRSSDLDESEDPSIQENGAKTRNGIDDQVKFVGFRQSGSRRKNTPRRAADVGVECYAIKA